MEVIIQRDYERMSRTAARIVADVLNTKPNAVLRMATGTPHPRLQQDLVRPHPEERPHLPPGLLLPAALPGRGPIANRSGAAVAPPLSSRA